MPQHWTINGRFLGQPLTGVQRYAWEIVRALDAELAADRGIAAELSLELVAPLSARLPQDLTAIGVRQVGPLRGHAWEQLVLPFHVKGGLLSLGNTGPVVLGQQLVCIHDLNSWAFPQSYSLTFRAMQRVLVRLLGRRCARIATVSSYSAGEIVRRGVCAADKLLVIPNGFEHVQRWPSTDADRPPPAARDTIVMIGTPAPHKNMGLILGMAERLGALGLKIAVVGSRDPKVYRSVGLTHAENVTWLGSLSDGQMAAVLANSLCLAFPSHVEGFGLPPLEAMALGCPVIVSNTTSLPEICGNAALYASPTDADAWLRCFQELHGNEPLRRQMVARGLEQAHRFSWRHSAQRYLAAMTEVGRASRGLQARTPKPLEAKA